VRQVALPSSTVLETCRVNILAFGQSSTVTVANQIVPVNHSSCYIERNVANVKTPDEAVIVSQVQEKECGDTKQSCAAANADTNGVSTLPCSIVLFCLPLILMSYAFDI
jgi:hypothetical protein